MDKLSMVLNVIRHYKVAKKGRKSNYNQDELVSHLYICIDQWIKDNPLIDYEQLRDKGCKEIRNWFVKIKYEQRPQISLEPAQPSSTDCSEVGNTLSVWCQTRHKREGKKALTRIVAYLHFVELLPVEELAEIFDRDARAIHGMIFGISAKRYPRMTFKVGDVVMLNMNNPFFHRMLAWVKEPTEYGAIVEVESHNYPERKKWELRATNEEMVYVGTLANKEINPIKPSQPVDGNKPVVSNAQQMHKYDSVNYALKSNTSNEPQYGSEECRTCGKMMMRRTGPCMICDNCQNSDGGCG